MFKGKTTIINYKKQGSKHITPKKNSALQIFPY